MNGLWNNRKRLALMVAFLALMTVLFGVAVYLHLDCQDLEAQLLERKRISSAETSVAVESEPSRPQSFQLQELQAEVAAVEAERRYLEQEIAELKEACGELKAEDTITMSELAELSPDEYDKFSQELKEHYAEMREGRHVHCEWEMLRGLEEDGLLEMKAEDRKLCEEYLSSYQEYVDGVLNDIWTEDEAEERFLQLEEKYKRYGKFLEETFVHALCEALGVATPQEAERKLANTIATASRFAMIPNWFYGRVLSQRFAREILEQDCPPLDYGLAPGEEDAEVRDLEERFAARREQP